MTNDFSLKQMASYQLGQKQVYYEDHLVPKHIMQIAAEDLRIQQHARTGEQQAGDI